MAENKADYIDELLKKGVIAFVPRGNSMWPTLKNRKQSVIVKKKSQRLKAMDVALYKRDSGTCVLHRVMKVLPNGYLMCGDSQFVIEKVAEVNVFGVMTAFYRGKRCIEVTDEDYIEYVKRLFANEKRRKFRVKMFFLRQKILSLPKRVMRKIFKRCKNNGENND